MIKRESATHDTVIDLKIKIIDITWNEAKDPWADTFYLKGKGKVMKICIAPHHENPWIAQVYMDHPANTQYLPLSRKRSPDGATIG